MKYVLAVIGGILLATQGASAQEVSVPPVTVASPGGYANPLKLDTDRYRQQKRKSGTAAKPAATRCSAEALPAGERQQLEREYKRRLNADGKPSADRWVAQQGQLFRARLVSQGVCPPQAGKGSAVRSTASSALRATARKRSGQKCTKTVMQARNIANPGGGAMSMIMVPVCVN